MVGLLSRMLLAGLTVALAAGSMVRPRPAPPARGQTPSLHPDHVELGDGTRLPLRCWQPDGLPKALVLGLHGYGDCRESFARIGAWLAAREVALVAYDQRGFGETKSRGVWPGALTLVHDLADVVAALRAEEPDLPLILLGESMGGSVALAGLGGGKVGGVDRLILAAPGVRAADAPLQQLHDVALKLGALALPWLAIELRRGARPWLAPEESARLADDPLILRELSVGTYDGLIELANLASARPLVPLPPTLLLYGALDRTITRQAIDELAEHLGERGALRVYPERHHLLLHETESEQVFADCLTWLLPARSHAA
ncbi:MAG TPA: alpha/beta fold hydrolase [Geminicoccaceae bacterium]|nr:alpha/beta fold hydrolase [Geminicoccaceae bacterium]